MGAQPYHDRDGFIWYNGTLVPWRDAKLHVLSHGLHYASVVFEGERPLQARFCHTSAGDSVSSELAEWRPVPREVQHTLRNAPPGTYELEWYRNQYDDGLPKAWD